MDYESLIKNHKPGKSKTILGSLLFIALLSGGHSKHRAVANAEDSSPTVAQDSAKTKIEEQSDRLKAAEEKFKEAVAGAKKAIDSVDENKKQVLKERKELEKLKEQEKIANKKAKELEKLAAKKEKARILAEKKAADKKAAEKKKEEKEAKKLAKKSSKKILKIAKVKKKKVISITFDEDGTVQ